MNTLNLSHGRLPGCCYLVTTYLSIATSHTLLSLCGVGVWLTLVWRGYLPYQPAFLQTRTTKTYVCFLERRCRFCSVERCKENAAGKDLEVADCEGLRGTGADWGCDQQRQNVAVGRSVFSVLHTHSSRLRPPASSNHFGQRHAQEEDGHAHGHFLSTASFVVENPKSCS